MAQRIGFVSDLHLSLRNPSTRKDNYFEAGIAKLEFILQNCDIVVQLGDFFNKARTEDIVKNRVLDLISRYNKPIYVVPGNHDIENDLLETLPNTSLMNLAYHNAVTLLTSDRVWNIGGLRIGVLDYDVDKAKKQSFENVDAVVGHHFYSWYRDPSKSIEEPDIAKYNTRYLFLGHDHEPHKAIQVGNTVIVRTGSILRTELNSYTPQMSPYFIVIDADIKSPEVVEIPHTSFEDTFFYEEKKTFKKCAKLISDIKSFLQGIDLKPESKKSIGSILENDLKAPKEVVDYLQLVYRVNHVPF